MNPITKVILSLVMVFGTAMATRGQEHALTVEQCRADSSKWLVQLATDSRGIDKLEFKEIYARYTEVTTCDNHIDHQNLVRKDQTVLCLRYQMLKGEYGVVVAARLEHFIQRHGLNAQFFDEDTAGAR